MSGPMVLRYSKRGERGFTIIEIMVALTISLILLFGVINIFDASKRSYVLQSGISRLHGNARYALDIMARSISMAGYKGDFVDNVEPFLEATTNGTGNESDEIYKRSDSIGVAYAASRDCLGNDTGENDRAGIAEDIYSVTSSGALQCNGLVVVDGVDNMQILYGIDEAKDSDPRIETYTDGVAEKFVAFDEVDADLLSNQTDLGGIVGVRIAILVNTDGDVSTTKEMNKYKLLDASNPFTFEDGKMRRVFSRTVLIRNYLTRPKHLDY